MSGHDTAPEESAPPENRRDFLRSGIGLSTTAILGLGVGGSLLAGAARAAPPSGDKALTVLTNPDQSNYEKNNLLVAKDTVAVPLQIQQAVGSNQPLLRLWPSGTRTPGSELLQAYSSG